MTLCDLLQTRFIFRKRKSALLKKVTQKWNDRMHFVVVVVHILVAFVWIF